MDIFKVLTMLGGLALFLFGMQVMGEGLEKRAGNQLKGILEKMTSNPIKGVLLGIAVTAVIQSSSATTVMIVGFVNSGIMQLSQAIGVIMGANVGTTVTSWILSLSGIQGDNFFVNMLKPSSFSPILAIIGVGMLLFSKSSKKKDTASIMLGFAVLMFGMQTMTDAVQPLASVPEFANLLLVFENPLMAVLAGAVLTAVIQSSSASVGILQAIAATGSLTYGAAIPIIMGQNIGTCITAILSSIGTNRNAKRTAVVHLLFNIIGTCICLALFYTLNAIVEFAFIGDSINALGIAIVHSTFNVICTALLLPFTKQLEKLVCLIIKDDKKTEEFQMLDDRLLATPSIAVEQCKKLSSEMANLARDGLVRSVSACLDYDATQAKIIAQEEDAVDMFEDKLGSYLVKLSQKTMSNSDSREITKILHTIGDLERISDRSVNISKATYELFEKKLS
ncbi:MAG: Na/Pi cotransporter family protein, partial [Oscillospiraceae bacterium]